MPARRNRPGKYGTTDQWDGATTRAERRLHRKYDNWLIVTLRDYERERPNGWHFLPIGDREAAKRLVGQDLLELNQEGDFCRIRAKFRDSYMIP